MKRFILGAMVMLCMAAPINAQENMKTREPIKQTKEEFQISTPFPIGELNTSSAKYFVGNSYVASMDAENGGPVCVTFEPACRNNWHIHHGFVQVLICVAGRGWYQEWGKAPVEMTPGTVITVPKGVKHWHGAANDSWFQHLVFHAKDEAKSYTEWLEPLNPTENKNI